MKGFFMKWGKIFLLLLITFVILAAENLRSEETGDDQGDKIVEVALSQLGRHDSEGGRTGLYHGHGQAWCSEFVCWCYWQAGVPMHGGRWNLGLCFQDWNLESAQWIKSYFRKHHRYYPIGEFPPDLTPRPGDYAFITNTNGDRSHSAIVKQVTTGPDGTETLITVEGNNRGRKVDVYEYPDWRHRDVGEGIVGGIGLRNQGP